VIELVWVFNALVLAYFVVANGFYVFLSLLAMRRMRRHVRRQRSLDLGALVDASGDLPVSLIVPAYNEAQTIVPVVRSMLTLAYATYDVVVVNDGSTDATLERLTDAFGLVRADRVPTSDVPTAPIRGVYRSREHPNVWVVDKENGGGKADALNAGLNHTRTPLVCALDADTLLEPDSLVRVVRPFLEDATTVAAGGVIRVANGCTISGGMVTDVRLPRSLLARFQVVEYMRAFVAARVGWDAIGGTLIISGAFGVFRRSVVADAGGFETGTVGEDMELVVRLHAHLRERRQPYRISFVPDPVAWTEAPETLRDLGGQRNRWQRGLLQVLRRHRRMFASPRYGVPGMVAFPFFVFVELLGPVVEVAGYAVFAVTMLLGWGSAAYAGAFVMLAVVLGSLISTFAVVLQELSFSRYRSNREVLWLVGLAMVESFGYRQLTLWWRLRGLISAFGGESAWGQMTRRGFGEAVPLSPPQEREDTRAA
jgi:cellulose synthase/poly-beta-1,6-N-acetylglucosamine synthase-like glycosyltransferase